MIEDILQDLLAWRKTINLVHFPEWSRRTEKLDEWVPDAAYEDLRYMDRDTLLGLISDMADLVLDRNQAIRLWDHTKALEKAVRVDADLDSTREVILDALRYSWEVAATPNHSDLVFILDLTKERFDCDIYINAFWESDMPRGKKEWRPGPKGISETWSTGDACGSLLGHIEYTRDHFLIFNFGESYFVSDAVDYLRELHKWEEAVANDAAHALAKELERVRRRFTEHLVLRLEEYMMLEDLAQRRDVHKEWKRRLDSRDWREYVQKELLDFLREEEKNRGEEE